MDPGYFLALPVVRPMKETRQFSPGRSSLKNAPTVAGHHSTAGYRCRQHTRRRIYHHNLDSEGISLAEEDESVCPTCPPMQNASNQCKRSMFTVSGRDRHFCFELIIRSVVAHGEKWMRARWGRSLPQFEDGEKRVRS